MSELNRSTLRQEHREKAAAASFKVVNGLRELAVSRALSSDYEDRFTARQMGPEIAAADGPARSTMDAYDMVDATRREVGDGSGLVENTVVAEAIAYATDKPESEAAKVRTETLDNLAKGPAPGYDSLPATARTEVVSKIGSAQGEADHIAADILNTFNEVQKF